MSLFWKIEFQKKVLNRVSHSFFLAVCLVFFVLGVTTYVLVEYILQRKRHNRWERYFSDKVELPDYMRTPSRQKKDKK